jgi:hypothetical protein
MVPVGGWEWLHLLGDQLGGLYDEKNLVAGTFEANSAMIPVENAIKAALKKGKRPIKYKVTSTLYGNTHIGEDIVQYIQYNNQSPLLIPTTGTLKAYRNVAFGGFEAKIIAQTLAAYLDLKESEIPEDEDDDD